MDEAIDELSGILSEIESYHGKIQAADDYRHVKELHERARQCLAKIHEEYKDMRGSYGALTEYF